MTHTDISEVIVFILQCDVFIGSHDTLYDEIQFMYYDENIDSEKKVSYSYS